MNLPSLTSLVATLEDATITLSGPALAVSGIIAGVDLLTGGHTFTSLPWLTLVWAITLLLTLDFQVLCLGFRARRVYHSTKHSVRKIVEIALAVLIAAAISYVSIQMQSLIAQVNAENVTIDQAAVRLGVNTLALIWERSTLVLVLIFMSGWLREQETTETKAEPPTPPVTLDLTQLVNELDSRLQQRVEQRIEAVCRQVEVKIEQVVSTSQEVFALKASTTPLQLPVTTTVHGEQQQATTQSTQPLHPLGETVWGEQAQEGTNPLGELDRGVHAQGAVNPLGEPDRGVHAQDGLTTDGEPHQGVQASASYGDDIEALLKAQPGLTIREVASQVGCSLTTANKWMQRLKIPGAKQS